jgi:acetamidase/formamidase
MRGAGCRSGRPSDSAILRAVIHELPLDRRTVHGHYSPELRAVLSVDPGDSVRFAVPNAGWHVEHDDDEPFGPLDPELDAGHALLGPIEVRGARAGQTLSVRIDEVTAGSWGVTFSGRTPFHWTLDAAAGTGTDERGTTVALAPFLGVIGMPPPEPGVHSTSPPRRYGGNLDCKELVAGTTLFLPIGVDGALLSAGDGHAAQGDGEVSGTAIECPCEHVQLTLDVRPDLDLRQPIAWTPQAWLAFGVDEDLDTAAQRALETMLDLMERERGLEREHALALASVVVDLRVTQVVNRTKGVHAVLRHDALR